MATIAPSFKPKISSARLGKGNDLVGDSLLDIVGATASP
jgi:hypothetical protein